MVKCFAKVAFFMIAFMPTMVAANDQTLQLYEPPLFADKERLNKIQKILPFLDIMYKEYATKHHFPGYAFGIMVDGKLVYSGGGGYTNISKKIAVTPHSMFRIASMTKSVTAMAILKLRDEGKLQLDDPVDRYLPALKSQQLTQDAPVITIRHLLTHNAGLPQDDPWADRKLAETETDFLALFNKGISFSNVPGVTYEYSNLGYTLLGYIIKKVSGVPYQEYIAKNIWQKLGMQEATWEFTEVNDEQLVQGYRWIDGQWQEEPLLHDGSYGAMGGMITSIESFSRYVAAHQTAWPPRNEIETGPLRRSSLREMHWPLLVEESNLASQGSSSECVVTKAYGYGLHWWRDCQGRIYIKHNGGLPGFGSNWTIMPEYGIGVILFANVTYAPADNINMQVLETLIKEAQLKPRVLPVSPMLKKRQEALVKLLPHWNKALESGHFADNFFLDYPLDFLKKESTSLFKQAGNIVRVGSVVPENQLRGYFMLEGEKADIKVRFTLTPENPALIQYVHIEKMLKNHASF